MLFVWLAAIHVAAVIAWEAAAPPRQPWLDEEWAPRLLVATAFVALLVPAIALVFDFDIRGSSPGRRASSPSGSPSPPSSPITPAVREDLFMMTSAGGAVMTVLTCAIGRVIFMELKLDCSACS